MLNPNTIRNQDVLYSGIYSGTLGFLSGANFNTTADQPISIHSAGYIVRKIIVANASANLTLAAGGIYTAAAKGGSAIVLAIQAYTALSTATKFLDLTLAAILGSDYQTVGTLFLSLTTGQGSAATADIYIIGDSLA